MKQTVTQFIATTRRLLTQPLGELNRWQRAARYAVGMARYGAHELKEDRASQMAAALTYRTIFSLIPLFVLSLLVFNSFGGFSSVGGDLRETIYEYLGLNAITLQAQTEQLEASAALADDPDVKAKLEAASKAVRDAQAESQQTESETPAAQEPAESAVDLTDPNAPSPDDTDAEPIAPETKARVDQMLTDLQNQVASVNFTSIGIIGLALLIWAALSLVVSLENCFNRVYHAPQGRPWHLRITIYWAVITLGPVLLALSFYMTNELVSGASSITGVGWFVGLLTPFASLAATWLLLLLIYSLLPNAKVQVRAALIGAFVAAVLWEASKWGFRLYVQRAVGYSALYGSLGLVPLFLLWLYVTWIVILFGLEISYISQTIKGTRFLRTRVATEKQSEAIVDSSAVLAVAAAVGGAFDRGEHVDASEIASAASLPGRATEALITVLHQAGLLHRLESDEDSPGSYTLARPAESIKLSDLLAAAQDSATQPNADDDHSQANRVARELRQLQSDAAARHTLRDLLEAEPVISDTHVG